MNTFVIITITVCLFVYFKKISSINYTLWKTDSSGIPSITSGFYGHMNVNSGSIISAIYLETNSFVFYIKVILHKKYEVDYTLKQKFTSTIYVKFLVSPSLMHSNGLK